MMPATSPASRDAVVEIVGDLTVQVAAEWKVRLLGALESLAPAGRLRVELSEVTELDTAGLQVLLLLHRQAPAEGRQVEFTGHSRAVLDVLALAHLQTELS